MSVVGSLFASSSVLSGVRRNHSQAKCKSQTNPELMQNITAGRCASYSANGSNGGVKRKVAAWLSKTSILSLCGYDGKYYAGKYSVIKQRKKRSLGRFNCAKYKVHLFSCGISGVSFGAAISTLHRTPYSVVSWQKQDAVRPALPRYGHVFRKLRCRTACGDGARSVR